MSDVLSILEVDSHVSQLLLSRTLLQILPCLLLHLPPILKHKHGIVCLFELSCIGLVSLVTDLCDLLLLFFVLFILRSHQHLKVFDFGCFDLVSTIELLFCLCNLLGIFLFLVSEIF